MGVSNMRTRTFFTVLLTTSVLVLAGLASAAGEPPKSSEEKDKFVLANDVVQVWFQGKKPMLRLLPASARSRAGSRGRSKKLGP